MIYKEILEKIIDSSNKNQISDILLAPNLSPTMRINGKLEPIFEQKLTADDISELIKLTMDEEQITLFAKNLEIDYGYSYNTQTRFRMNAFYTISGQSLAMRKINTKIPNLLDINIPDNLISLIKQEQGLILVVGPTGSGKSTTLAGIVEYINQNHRKHIITIEDPVEFVFSSKKSVINQRELVHNTHSFPDALRSTLREDPDVIMLGEMRDPETARLALTAAETGHLVLSTLHTNSAYQSINRIIDMFPGDGKNLAISLLSESLTAIVSQRLVPLKNQTGRVAAHEVLIATPAVKNLIRENKVSQIYSMMQVGSKYGMVTLEESLRSLVRRDVIDKEIADRLLIKL